MCSDDFSRFIISSCFGEYLTQKRLMLSRYDFASFSAVLVFLAEGCLYVNLPATLQRRLFYSLQKPRERQNLICSDKSF